MNPFRSFNSYEFTDAAIPGAVFVLGELFLLANPSLSDLTNWSLGSLLLFLLIAYAAGQIAQIIGALLEGGWWAMRGGMPVDWLRTGVPDLLPADQIAALEGRLRKALKLPPEFRIAGLTRGSWYFVVRQMAGLSVGSPEQESLDTLQGQYRIARGLSAVLLALAITCLLIATFQLNFESLDALDMPFVYGAGFGMGFAVLALFRMERFAVQYALELIASVMLHTQDDDSQRSPSIAPPQEALVP